MKNLLRSAASILFGKILPRIAYPVVRGPLRGNKFILGSSGGKGAGATVYFNMSEKNQTDFFVKNLKTNDVFFDIGANVGYYTVLGSKLVGKEGRVFAFEPLIRNLFYLYRHTILNALKNVTIIPLACSDTISIVSFSQGPNSAMGHISNLGISPINSEKDLSLVCSVSLDEVSRHLSITPAVIKIDVEGAELNVLRGMKNLLVSNRPKIFLSVHSDILRDECLKYLTDFGYEFKPLDNYEFFCNHPSIS